MKTTIDAAGRLVIPKRLREQAGFEPGMQVEVRCRDGRIEVEPAEPVIHLEERDGFLVAVADGEISPVTDEIVEETLRTLREERGKMYDSVDGD
ncbi:MAG: AbrB/MazE/SpoVT family DNA-binding domain-containing protein [Dehalococcoidia bacterium]